MNIVKPLFVILFIFLLEISMAVFIFTYFKETSSNASVSPNNNNGNEGACEGENCINPQPEKTKYPDKSTTIENSPQTDIPSMEPPPEVRVCKSETCLKSAITLKANMDLNVDPCEDFYRYTCGG
ncbi:neprilysin-11-like [Physella acuta]|uniref:neprilysin-11-like n=1 Tax=Physella acuta TaxID=109671 RepID=UPI0027DD5E9E|nr:neprilysin-11-like [Physella acuta]